MLIWAAAVADWVRQYLGYGEATLTGGREPADAYGPARVAATLHPGGMAVDFRTNDLPGGPQGYAAQTWATTLARALGDDFQVLLEADHVHVEWNSAMRA
jgi:hypothetical protein